MQGAARASRLLYKGYSWEMREPCKYPCTKYAYFWLSDDEPVRRCAASRTSRNSMEDCCKDCDGDSSPQAAAEQAQHLIATKALLAGS